MEGCPRVELKLLQTFALFVNIWMLGQSQIYLNYFLSSLILVGDMVLDCFSCHDFYPIFHTDIFIDKVTLSQ